MQVNLLEFLGLGVFNAFIVYQNIIIFDIFAADMKTGKRIEAARKFVKWIGKDVYEDECFFDKLLYLGTEGDDELYHFSSSLTGRYSGPPRIIKIHSDNSVDEVYNGFPYMPLIQKVISEQ